MVQHWCTVHAPWHVAMHLKKALLAHGGSMPRVWLACLGEAKFQGYMPSATVRSAADEALSIPELKLLLKDAGHTQNGTRRQLLWRLEAERAFVALGAAGAGGAEHAGMLHTFDDEGTGGDDVGAGATISTSRLQFYFSLSRFAWSGMPGEVGLRELLVRLATVKYAHCHPVAHNAYRHITSSADVECSRMAALVWEDDAVAWACRVLPRFGQVWSLFVHDIVPVVDPIAKWEGGDATAFLQALPYYIAKLAAFDVRSIAGSMCMALVRLSHWLEHRPDVLSNMAANTEKLHDLILNEFANARIRAVIGRKLNVTQAFVGDCSCLVHKRHELVALLRQLLGMGVGSSAKPQLEQLNQSYVLPKYASSRRSVRVSLLHWVRCGEYVPGATGVSTREFDAVTDAIDGHKITKQGGANEIVNGYGVGFILSERSSLVSAWRNVSVCPHCWKQGHKTTKAKSCGCHHGCDIATCMYMSDDDDV